jgi:hypothetical protein
MQTGLTCFFVPASFYQLSMGQVTPATCGAVTGPLLFGVEFQTKKNNSAKDGIDETYGSFRQNSGCSGDRVFANYAIYFLNF